LFRVGLNGSDPNDWFLRSSFRVEPVPPGPIEPFPPFPTDPPPALLPPGVYPIIGRIGEAPSIKLRKDGSQ
jgi:hypothetical protein